MILACYFSKKRDAMSDLFKNLIEAMPSKEEIAVVIPSAYKDDTFSNNIGYKVVEDITSIKSKGKRLLYLIPFFFRLRKKLKKYNIDKIYLQNDIFIFNFLIWLMFRKSATFTLWLHDPILHEGVPKKEKIHRFFSMLTYFHEVKNFILSYHSIYDNISKIEGLSCYKNRMKVISLPQMPEMEFADIADMKNNLGIIEYDYIFFGRIEEYKGLELFIDAFRETVGKKKLLIVGTGNDEEIIKKKVNLDHRIKFINRYVDNRDLAKYIVKSKCVILPYKSATGSQTVAIANYYGRIVLATKVGCFPEYIREGENGFFIEDYTVEAMKDALKKVDYYIDCCTPEKIENIYNQFDINRIANQLYHEIIS